MKIVCISDTHNQLDKIGIPDGDILIHAGDATNMGTLNEVTRFLADLEQLPHKHKILIAGNHDFLFQRDVGLVRSLLEDVAKHGVIYLQDGMCEIGGLKIWGSPWQPEFGGWAFNLRRGKPLKERWDLIPTGIDILVTHGPPFGIGDKVYSVTDEGRTDEELFDRGENKGCQDLRIAVARVQPRLHVFGHIHSGYGRYEDAETTFVNAAMVDEHYKPGRAPIVIEI